MTKLTKGNNACKIFNEVQILLKILNASFLFNVCSPITHYQKIVT